jgi:hypothetical protein
LVGNTITLCAKVIIEPGGALIVGHNALPSGHNGYNDSTKILSFGYILNNSKFIESEPNVFADDATIFG